MKLSYKDIHVVESFEEAEQFRYEDTDEPVEIGTPVGYDDMWSSEESVKFILFTGITCSPDE